MTKKGHQKFLPRKWNKSSSWSAKIFSVPPKLGFRFPPLDMDKMVYGQSGIRTKWYWTKWYGQNGTDKIINQSINPAPTDNTIFSSIALPLRHLYVSCV